MTKHIFWVGGSRECNFCLSPSGDVLSLSLKSVGSKGLSLNPPSALLLRHHFVAVFNNSTSSVQVSGCVTVMEALPHVKGVSCGFASLQLRITLVCFSNIDNGGVPSMLQVVKFASL